MERDKQIRRFVQESLGCTCPEKVFDEIEYQSNRAPSADSPFTRRICVGGRLLIYILETDDSSCVRSRLEEMVSVGKAERDTRQLNRFRAVVATDDPSVGAAAEQAFQDVPIKDEKVHLHVVSRDDVAF